MFERTDRKPAATAAPKQRNSPGEADPAQINRTPLVQITGTRAGELYNCDICPPAVRSQCIAQAIGKHEFALLDCNLTLHKPPVANRGLGERVLAKIAERPGIGSDELAVQLEVDAKPLAHALARLKREGRIRMAGRVLRDTPPRRWINTWEAQNA